MSVSSSSSTADRAPVFELKAAGFTLPVVRLLGADIDAIAEALGAKVEQAPDFFRNAPVVIDLSALPEEVGAVELPLLVGLLRGYGMIPFGVRGGDKSQHAAAEAMELAILGDSYVRGGRQATPEAESRSHAGKSADAGPGDHSGVVGEEDPRRQAAAGGGFHLVTRPVRSGQRIYAAGGDLSVTAAVSSGAELMADGNIHVYGALRGRALAGMSGNLDARIFCQDLQAELVSIAGHYRVSENIPMEVRGIPVQVYLDQKILRIERL